MDDKHFDYLTKSIVAGSRRGVLHLLALLPLGGWLEAFTAERASSAKRRKGKGRGKVDRQVGADNHQHEHRRRKHKNHNRNQHGKKQCKPRSLAQTCDGKCGQVRIARRRSTAAPASAILPAQPARSAIPPTGNAKPIPHRRASHVLVAGSARTARASRTRRLSARLPTSVMTPGSAIHRPARAPTLSRKTARRVGPAERVSMARARRYAWPCGSAATRTTTSAAWMDQGPAPRMARFPAMSAASRSALRAR